MDRNPDKALLDGFATRLSRQGYSPRSIVKYRHGAADFLGWWQRDPADARRPDLEAYLDRVGATSTPGTVRNRIAALRRFYDYIDSLGRLVDAAGNDIRSPAERVEPPRQQRRANDWLQPDEDKALLGSPLTAQERIVVYLLRWTGMRIGEAVSLTWRDVDLARGEIRVRASKTASGIRTVPVLPELDGELRQWRRRLSDREAYAIDGPVLATNRCTAMKATFAWRVLKRTAARAGVRTRAATDANRDNLSTISPHTLRRTFASDLLNRGVRIETVAKVLGHSDTRVTATYYAEMLASTARDEIMAAMAG